ncbi:hypothetical protein Pcinc_025870 [Petrolisthes cinctipes]|uniref:Uncharacterized protein n=1 Tax=Petrolisthes cinctipes TaxID=88211 RepID=A0AAE1F9S6_PETCI|nr:hypothetical protein Pcinc_025870 [Petrolisthes cinctipes]
MISLYFSWAVSKIQGQLATRLIRGSSYSILAKRNMEDDSEVQNTVGAELRKNRGASFCKICSVFLTHHKKIQPLLKLRLLEELNNLNFIVPTHHKKIQPLLKLRLLEELNNLNFIVPIAALSLRIPPIKPSC